jgi:hypothetical protein
MPPGGAGGAPPGGAGGPAPGGAGGQTAAKKLRSYNFWDSAAKILDPEDSEEKPQDDEEAPPQKLLQKRKHLHQKLVKKLHLLLKWEEQLHLLQLIWVPKLLLLHQLLRKYLKNSSLL